MQPCQGLAARHRLQHMSERTYSQESSKAGLSALAAGGQGGRFAPSPRTETDLETWRSEIMEQFPRVNAELRTNIARWTDDSLDRFQLPHPLLGKLTVREMLFFTLYHQRHHRDVIERRR